MAMQYQGKNIASLRPAIEGDEGFKAGTDQVVVSLADGTSKTIKRSEVKDEAQQEQEHAQAEADAKAKAEAAEAKAKPEPESKEEPKPKSRY